MRDQNRPITRIDFSLDNKRLLFLGVGGFIILLLFFSLGVMVGKRLGQVACPDHTSTLAAVEKEEQVYNKLKQQIETREQKEQPELVPVEVAKEDKKDKEQQAEIVKQEPQVEPKHEPLKQEPIEPEKKKESDFEKQIKKIVEEEKKVEEVKKKINKPEVKTVIAKEIAKVEKTTPVKNEPAKKEVVKVKESTPSIKEMKDQTPAPKGRYYAIQIFSVSDKNRADDYIKKYPAFDQRKPYAVAVDIPGKGTWYRVKIGKFSTKEQALAYQSIFESKTGRKGTILTLD